jgi:hypothetical protein
MQRREFIAGLGGTAAWPVVAGGQQGERKPRVGVLMGFEESNLEAKAFLSAFTQGLAELGWTDGHILQMDVRWTAANIERARIYAKELVDLQPCRSDYKTAAGRRWAGDFPAGATRSRRPRFLGQGLTQRNDRIGKYCKACGARQQFVRRPTCSVPRSPAIVVTPVTLPPGRLRLATNPVPTGSPPVMKTMGSVVVVVFSSKFSCLV